MKIALINYEMAYGLDAILSKYTRMLERELIDMGHEVVVSDKPVKGFINHHINFIAYDGKREGKNTTMITHLTGDKNRTEAQKIAIVKEQEKTAHGICLTSKMKEKLVKAGCDEKKLSVILPAHDSLPRRPRIIAIITNVYPDGRKREDMFVKMFRSLKDKKAFIFRIMGEGWKPVLEPLKRTIQVSGWDKFMVEPYLQILSTSDYLLYTGDEDSLAQSVIDATQAGLKVIAPPQEDIAVEYPFRNQEELNAIFKKLQENPVKEWTWENYAKAHCKVWETL